MKNVEDRELDREMKALASQISIPAGSLHGRSGTTLGRALTVAGAAVVLVAAIAVGAAINNARSAKDNAGVAATPTPAVTSSASPSIRFPDYSLIAGTINGFVYKVEAGQVRGSPVDVCHGQAVLAMHLSSSARSVLIICGGTTEGQAVVLDTATLAQRWGPIAVMPRMDVGAWAPDERSIALLQQGVCEPQAPVCSVHVLLWDLASGSTRVIRPDEPLTFNVRWTVLGLSISFTQSPQSGTLIWDGHTWSHYSPHALWLADTSGHALLVEATTGNWGGPVWESSGGQEVALSTSGTEYPLGLDGDRAIVWRDTPFTNSGVVVVYRGQREEREVPGGLCLAAQQIDRWLVCTTSGSAALAYSLDANAFAQQPITGLARFYVLVALPKSGQASTPPATPPVSVEARVRAEAPSLSFRPLIPGDAPADSVSVTSRGGGRDPRTGGDARLLQIELTDQVGALRALIIEGPAGCCLDYARPNAIPDVSIGARPIGHYDNVAAAFGGPIVWWVDGDAYVAVSSPVLGQDELLRIAGSMQALP